MTQTTTQTGAVIGNAARARMSADYFAPTNVWSAVVVRSGERKSPVLRAVMQPLHTRQDKAAEEHAQAMAEYESELEKWRRLETKVRRVRDRPVEPGSYPHLFLSGTTTEAIMQRLVEQRRGLAVVLVELSGFFSGMNQYRTKGGNDREAYLAFYDAGAAKIDRKSATPQLSTCRARSSPSASRTCSPALSSTCPPPRRWVRAVACRRPAAFRPAAGGCAV